MQITAAFGLWNSEIKQILVHAYPLFNFQWKIVFTCLYLICLQSGKKSLWIGGHTLKKMTGGIWKKFFWCLALIIHENANILRDIVSWSVFFVFFHFRALVLLKQQQTCTSVSGGEQKIFSQASFGLSIINSILSQVNSTVTL